MHYVVYKVSNKITGKFYVGSHKTSNLDDGYMGSGKYLKRAQQKYGLVNFSKEILHVFDTADEMYAKEAEIVNEDFLATQNTYNLKLGGHGGFDYVNDNPDKFLTEKRLKALWTNKDRIKRWREKYSSDPAFRDLVETNRRLAVEAHKKKYPNGAFYGKKHTAESRAKIGLANAKKMKGKNNHQYGSMWITDGVVSIKQANDLPVPSGWRKGRVIKNNR